MSFNLRDSRFIAALVSHIEEGLVLTVGLLSGMAIAGISEKTIVLVGIIFVITGGISAAARNVLTRSYGDAEAPVHHSAQEGVMMALLYIVAGIVPLLPYMLMEVSRAFTTSIVCSFAAAFIIGLWSGHHGPAVWKSSYHLAYVAAAGAIIGAIAHMVLQ